MTAIVKSRRARLAVILVSSGVAVGVVTEGGSAAASSTPSPPRTVAATIIPRSPRTLRPGKLVRSGALSRRVFPDARHGFALALVANVSYPAASSDGGRTWRIDGPALHLPALQAPLVVTQTGAAGARTYFAYGGPDGGQSVDVTRDAGAHWYRAFLGEVVMAVVSADHGRLIAFAQTTAGSSTTAVNLVYVSRDRGRHWHYDAQLGAL
jgi:hypothetical protein